MISGKIFLVYVVLGCERMGIPIKMGNPVSYFEICFSKYAPYTARPDTDLEEGGKIFLVCSMWCWVAREYQKLTDMCCKRS